MPVTRNQVIEQLRSAGISPSEPRVAVLQELLSRPCHPSVDTLYRHLHSEHPTLSRTTVYNVLKLLSEHQLVRSLSISDSETRYDGTTAFHGHILCRRCGCVTDVFGIRPPSISSETASRWAVDGAQINFYGLCESCQRLPAPRQ